MLWTTGWMALLLAGVHLFAGRLTLLGVIPRSRWLSAAGGISVAYVFVHLLPELARVQETFREGLSPPFGYLDHHAFLLSLAGLTAFYGLERAMVMHRRKGDERNVPSGGLFWAHLLAFSFYNFLIGYLLLHREEAGWKSLVFFFAAMAVHFVVNDYGLRHHYGRAYQRIGRWALASSVVGGWLAGASFQPEPLALPIFFALLSGGVVLNVLKEELPEERESRFWAFALGAGGYAALLLLI